VLLDKDARSERRLVVAVEHRHRSLHDDRAAVDALVDEVHRAARHLRAVRERLLLRMEAGEGRQQAGVDVEHALRVAAQEGWREQPHEAGEADPLDAVCGEGVEDRRLVRRAVREVAPRQARS